MSETCAASQRVPPEAVAPSERVHRWGSGGDHQPRVLRVRSNRASGAARTVTTTRGPGQFIGEASLFEGGRGDATWKTSVRAKGKVRALLLTRSHLRSLLRQRPEAEAAVRAGAASALSRPVTYLAGAPLRYVQQEEGVTAVSCDTIPSF